MGKISDVATALVILILFLFVAARLGLTITDIISLFHSFFFGSP